MEVKQLIKSIKLTKLRNMINFYSFKKIEELLHKAIKMITITYHIYTMPYQIAIFEN